MVWTDDEYRKAFDLIEHCLDYLTRLERSFLIRVCVDYNRGCSTVTTLDKDALRCLYILYTEARNVAV